MTENEGKHPKEQSEEVKGGGEGGFPETASEPLDPARLKGIFSQSFQLRELINTFLTKRASAGYGHKI